MPETDYTPSDQPMTLGQRLLRTRGAAALDDDPTGEPTAGATPNTKEPHQNTGAAAQGDSAAQSPAGRPSIGQRMLGSSNPTAGITAHNNDGSPAEMATGTDAAGRPSISIKPAAATAPTTAPTIGQRLTNLRPPPAAPQMNPQQAAVQQDLREHSQVTPKTDPTTGKTLDQYKMGFGQRLLGSLVNFGNGFAHTGAEPIHVGPGATNRRYAVDETNRQQRVAGDQAKIKSMDDEYNQAEKGYGHELTSYNDEARAAGKADSDEINQKRDQERASYNQQIADVRQQLADAKDPAAKMQAEAKARAAVSDQLGLKGRDALLYKANGKLPDDEQLAEKTRLAEERIGIQRDRLAIDKEKADNAKSKNQATFKDAPSIDKYSDQWYLKQRDQVRKDKAEALKNAGGDAKKAQDDYAEIEASYKQKTGEFEKRKAGWYNQVKGGKPVTVQNSEDGIPDAAPAGEQGIKQPIAPVRTGAPAQQKTAPATQAPKSISKAQVQELAKKHNLSYEDAAKQFTGKGYAIN